MPFSEGSEKSPRHSRAPAAEDRTGLSETSTSTALSPPRLAVSGASEEGFAPGWASSGDGPFAKENERFFAFAEQKARDLDQEPRGFAFALLRDLKARAQERPQERMSISTVKHLAGWMPESVHESLLGGSGLFQEAYLFSAGLWNPALPDLEKLKQAAHPIETVFQRLRQQPEFTGVAANTVVMAATQDEELLEQIKTTLSERGADPSAVYWLGSGDEAVVFELRDHKVGRITTNLVQIAPWVAAAWQPVESKNILPVENRTPIGDGRFVLEESAKADTGNITQADVDAVTKELARERLHLRDPKPENLGWWKGRVVVLDHGAVWTEAQLALVEPQFPLERIKYESLRRTIELEEAPAAERKTGMLAHDTDTQRHYGSSATLARLGPEILELIDSIGPEVFYLTKDDVTAFMAQRNLHDVKAGITDYLGAFPAFTKGDVVSAEIDMIEQAVMNDRASAIALPPVGEGPPRVVVYVQSARSVEALLAGHMGSFVRPRDVERTGGVSARDLEAILYAHEVQHGLQKDYIRHNPFRYPPDEMILAQEIDADCGGLTAVQRHTSKGASSIHSDALLIWRAGRAVGAVSSEANTHSTAAALCFPGEEALDVTPAEIIASANALRNKIAVQIGLEGYGLDSLRWVANLQGKLPEASAQISDLYANIRDEKLSPPEAIARIRQVPRLYEETAILLNNQRGWKNLSMSSKYAAASKIMAAGGFDEEPLTHRMAGDFLRGVEAFFPSVVGELQTAPLNIGKLKRAPSPRQPQMVQQQQGQPFSDPHAMQDAQRNQNQMRRAMHPAHGAERPPRSGLTSRHVRLSHTPP